MEYRKKPVVIEAWQFTYPATNVEPKWLKEAQTKGPVAGHVTFELDHPDGPRIAIFTLEGVMIANVNDWIIKGVQDEIYPCKPGIFEQTYEAVEA